MSEEPPTVDISVIEHQKENIIPRKHGRSAVALSNLLSAPRPQLAKQLAEGHAKHQEAVQIAIEEDEDPIAAYVSYVDWVVECYPAGSNSESGLVPLLERATREFREDPRYINDLRYLKLWICYAGIVEKPETIYAYLLANDIGSVWELFYTEYANTLERNRNMRKADEIYQLGIARKAKPLKRLQQRYEEFQKRILAAPAGSLVDTDEVLAPAPPAPTARKVLGERTKPTSSADGDPFIASSSSRPNNNGARIPVFRDGDQPDSGIQTNEWADVGTRDSRRKENHSDGKSWQGETLPQLKHGVFTPKTPKIEIYRDTEDPAPARTPHGPRPGHEDVFAPSHQPKESEALRQNPFKNWDSAPPPKQSASGLSKSTAPPPTASSSIAPVASSSVPSPKASTSDSLPAWPKPKSLKPLPSLPKRLRNPAPGPGKRAEQICLPLARLQASSSNSSDGPQEYSPDEARARALGLLGKKWAPPPVVVAVPVRDDAGRNRTSDGAAKGAKKEKERTMTMTMAGEPTVTVNTRAALGDVFEMFNTSPAKDKGRADRIEEEDEAEEAVAELRPTLSMMQLSEGQKAPPTPTPVTGSSRRADNANRPPVPYFEIGRSGGENAGKGYNENGAMSLNENPPRPNENAQNDNVFRVPNENGSGLSARTPGAKMPIFVDDPATAAKAKIPVFRDEPEPGATLTGVKNVLKPKSFTPFVDPPAEEPPAPPVTMTPGGPLKPKTFAPFVDPPVEPKTPKAFAVFQDEDAEEPSSNKFTLPPPPQLSEHEEYDEPVDDEDDEDDGRYAPMGNRLGYFNVMTPITERTCEFTTTTMRAAGVWKEEIAEEPEEAEEERADAVPEPVNPFSPAVLQDLMSRVPAPPSVQDLSDTNANQLDALIKFGKSKKGDEFPITLGEADEYSVVAKIGEGGYGAVFLAMYMPEDEEEDDSGFVDDDTSVAVKVVRPGDRWEYTVLSRLRTALPPNLLSSVIRPRRLYHYQDESFLVMDYSGQGSLLDTVNRSAACGFSPANSTHPGLDELLVMFFSIELLRLISAIHAAGFVHGDLKIDNCLLRTEDVPDEARAWSPKYDPSGAHGWSYKGIRMIDFGRGIDTSLFPPGQTFIGDWPTDQRDAVELREARPWTFQTDYFGLAGIVYCMLFGKYIETVPVQDGARTKYKINVPLKRYWQTEIWSSLFDMLLNPTTVRPDGSMPLTAELDELRENMERWLTENCDKGSRSLKSLLKKVSIAATERQPI